MVIDDDQDFCSLVSMLVEKEGFSSECAYTLNESITKLESSAPQIILLDNNLPDGKGIDFFANHKQLFSRSRVLMITADPTEGLRKLALQHGVSTFLNKPLLLNEFRKLIRQPAI